MSKHYLNSLVLFIILGLNTLSGQSNEPAIDFDSENWLIDDPQAKMMTYSNQKSLYLTRGNAILKNVEFENGTIEVDFNASGLRGFGGIIFRYQSKDSYELFYLRPHKTRLSDAFQYTPVFNGLSAWQLYSKEGYTASAEIPRNRWVHLKLVISGTKMLVYLDNSGESNLVVTDLKRGNSKGKIGLWGRNGAMNFANFRYNPAQNAALKTESTPSAATPAGMITRWELSEAFVMSDPSVEKLPSRAKLRVMNWLPAESEQSGLVNISRFRYKATASKRNIVDNARDLIYAKTVIHSDRAQVKKLSFGYSDEISIFLNGQILFTGNSTFRSRDPGFLGIVGVDNDALYLNLKKGDNELILAVTETFGGWGFICRLDDMSGRLRE